MENKKNDWFATLLFQPNMTLQDFANNDITPDNTSINTREYYKNIPQVIEAFKNEKGQFDETKFDTFYQSALSVYNDYANSKFENKLLETFEYDPFDYFAPAGSKIKDNLPSLEVTANPERRSAGLENIFGRGNSTMSVREVAQQNKVFNWDTQTFEDWTPNEKGGIWKALKRPTLVLATWDDDGTHEVNGRILQHKKGDLKFNEDGDTYYETLGDRDIYGKQVLNIEDTLTVDGSIWNKYDFFDSDGLDKSFGGTIAKLVFKVGPMLIPYVGPVYGALSAGTELAQLIPTLMKSINGIIGGDNDSDFIKKLNQIEGYASRFDSSVSDYSQQKLLSWENLGKMIEDTSLQLFQQRVIAQIPKILTNAPDSIKVRKLGRNLALAYMAGTSSQQAYSEFKQAGATDAVAGLGMLSVMGGLYGLMNQNYFRNFLFKGTYMDEAPTKQAVKDLAQEVKDNITKWSVNTPKQAASFVTKGKKFFQDQFKKYNKIDVINSATNEATEEVMEEVTSDLAKALFAAGSALGIDMTESEKNLDFQWSVQDATQRYLMSFFGGAIGGPVFQLHTKWQNRLHGISNNLATSSDNQTAQEIVYLIRQGRTEDIKKELDRLHKKGKLGDVNLSGMTGEFVNVDNEPQIKFYNAEFGESQNDVVYKQLIDYIDRVDSLITSEGLKVPDEVLKNLQVYQQEGKPYDVIAETILSSSVTTQIFNDFNDISTKMLRKAAELSKLEKSEPNTPITNETQKAIAEQNNNNLEIQKIKQEIEDLRSQRDAILRGDKTGYYFGQALFATNSAVNSAFVNMGLHNYVKAVYGKDFDLLNSDEQKIAKENFEEYSQLDEKTKVYKAYDLFLSLNQRLKNKLLEINDNTKIANNIYGLGYSTLGNISNEIDKINTQIEELKNDSTTDHSKEIEALTTKKDLLQNIQQQYIHNTSFVISNPLSPEGQAILHRPVTPSPDINIEQYGQSILNFYNYLKENNLSADFGDLDISVLLQSIKADIDKSNISLKQKYIDWLNNLYQRNPDYESEDPLTSDVYINSGYEKFNSLLNELQATLSGTVDQVNSKLSEIFNFLNQFNLEPEILEDLIDYILPKIGDYRIDEYLNQYNLIRSQVKVSPIYDLLNEFIVSLGGQPSQLLNILSEEHNRFTSSKDVLEYIIQDKNAKEQLEQLKLFLNGIESILNASNVINGSGINLFINRYFNEDLLPTIDTDTFYNLQNDIALLRYKLDVLLDTSKSNQERNARIQKDITINMKQIFINDLVNEKSLIRENFLKQFNIDLLEIWNKYKPSEEVTEQNFDNFEDSVIKFETELFETIYSQQLDNEILANKLAALFNSDELYKQKSTDLNTDSNNHITNYDALLYLASIISTPSQNFYAELKPIITSDEFNKIPIFSQEHAVRIGYAMVYNPQLFNKIIDKLVPKNSDLSDYVRNRLKLYNFYSVFGGAGVGKTTSIGYLLKTLFEHNSSFISIAPTIKQAQKLSESINSKEKIYDKVEFIKSILGRELTTDDYEIHDTYITLKDSIIPLKTNLFDNQQNKILFIDEVSHFLRPELELISKWAIDNDVLVITFGDKKQDSAEIVINNKPIIGGIEDTYLIKSPNLTATLRPSNIAKYDNYVVLNSILEKSISKYEDDPDMDPIDLTNYTKTYWEKGIRLEYYENNSTFVGEKIVDNQTEFNAYIDKISKLSNNIAIITDNTSKYTGLPQNTKVIDLASVQGSEFDYVLIDKDWHNRAASWGILRNLYTLTQRSTKGSIILDNDRYLRNSLNLSTQFSETVNNNIEIKQSDIQSFKDWRLKSLNKIESNPLYSNLSYSKTFTPNEPQSIITDELQLPIDNKPNVTITQKIKEEQINSKLNEVVISELKNNISEPSTISKTESPINAQEDVIEPIVSEKPTIVQNNISPVIDTVDRNTMLIDSNITLDWFDTELWNYDSNENTNSIKQQLDFGNSLSKEKYAQYIHKLSSYFLYGYYKRPTQYKLKLEQLLSRINPDLDDKSDSIISALSNAQLKIIPYKKGKQGLLVADIEAQYNNKPYSIRIPILLTDNNFGNYNGDIIMTKNVTYDSNGIVDKSISSLNPNNYFTILPYNVTFVIKDEQFNSIVDKKTKEVIRINKGKAMGLISGDPFLNEIEFKKDLHPELDENNNTTYLIQSDARFVLFGVQQTKLLSEIITQARADWTALNVELNKVTDDAKILGQSNEELRTARKLVYDKYNDSDKRLIYSYRTGQIITELLNFAKETTDDPIKRNIQLQLISYKNDLGTNKTYKSIPSLMFTLNFLNKQTGLIESKSFLTKLEHNELVLYSLNDNKVKGINEKLTSVSGNIDNIYTLIEYIGNLYNIDFKEYINPKTLQTYFVDYNYQKQVELNGTKQWETVNLVQQYSTLKMLVDVTKGITNLDILDDAVSKSDLFRNGIYVEDHKDKNPITSYIFKVTDPISNYKVDITKFYAPVFALDKSKIIKTLEQEKQIQIQKEKEDDLIKFNEFLRAHNLPETTNTDINQAIIDINTQLKINATDISYNQIEFDPIVKNYLLITINDNKNLIQNKLKEANIDNSNITTILTEGRRKIWNFIPFYISLQDKINGYALVKNNDKWDLIEFSSIREYKELYDYFSEIKANIPSSINKEIINYLNGLFLNKNITNNTANKYYQTISQYITEDNELKSTLEVLNNYVIKYLQARVQYHEC